MKKLTYLIVSMLLALTVLGCQVDLSDYLTKEEAEKTYATKSELSEAVKDLQAKINDVDAKFADYYTKGDIDSKLEGYATIESLETLGNIEDSVKSYLKDYDFSEYLENGYSNEEINAKFEAVNKTIDSLSEVYETIENVKSLSDRLESLETTVNEFSNGLTENEIRTIIEGYGYVTDKGLSESEIKAIIETYGYTTITEAKVKELIESYGYTTVTDDQIKTIIESYNYATSNGLTETEIKAIIEEYGYSTLTEEQIKTIIAQYNSDNNIGGATTVSITDTQIAQIKADLQTWCSENIKGETIDLTNYALKTDLKDWLTSDDLVNYATTADIPTDYVSSDTFASYIVELENRIITVEQLIEQVSEIETEIDEIKVGLSLKADTDNYVGLESALMGLQTTVNAIDLTQYLKVEDAITEAKVREIVESYGYVTNSGLSEEQIRRIVESYGYTTDKGLSEEQIKAIVESYGYVTDNGLSEAEVKSIVEQYGYSTLTEEQIKAIIERYNYSTLTTDELRTIIEGYGYVTSSGYTEEQIKAIVESYGYVTDNGLSEEQVRQIVEGYNYVTSSGYTEDEIKNIIANYDFNYDYATNDDLNDLTDKYNLLADRITAVENMLKADGEVGARLTSLETTVSSKASSNDLTSLSSTVADLKSDYETTKATVSNIDLSKYLTIETAVSDYATKSSVETLTTEYNDLADRVSTLETLTNGYADLKTTVNNLSLAVNSLNADIYDTTDADGNTVKGLKSTLAELKTTVADNYSTLITKIGDSDTNISAIASRVSALETAKDNYKSYCDNAINGLADTYAVKSALDEYAKTSDLDSYVKKSEVATTVADAIANDTTIVTKTYLESQNYLTSSSLSGYATTEALNTLSSTVTTATENITSLQSAVATLEADKTKVEFGYCEYYISSDNPARCYFDIFIKITTGKDGNFIYLVQQKYITFEQRYYNISKKEITNIETIDYDAYVYINTNGTWAFGKYGSSSQDYCVYIVPSLSKMYHS